MNVEELDAGVKGEVMKAAVKVEKERELKDLISIGPAMLRDFELLGIRSVKELARQDAKKLYANLGRVEKQHQDICVLDTFEAAVAQAKNPRLAVEKCQWWWWSEKRKKENEGRRKQGVLGNTRR